MEFSCSRDNLHKAVQIVERIVSTRSTLPIIGNLLFVAEKNSLKILANNLEVGIELKIEADVKKEGSTLIPAKTLAGIVSKLPSEKIIFQLKERGIVNLSYKKSKFNLHSLPADEFPQIAKVKEEKSFSIEAEDLNRMVAQTIFASSSAEDKYVLNGVLFEISKAKGPKKSGESAQLRLVATDGYRLACSSTSLEEISGGAAVIVPNRALSEVNRYLQLGKKGKVKIIISKEYISFRIKDFYLVSRLIQGQFPDYRQVIPQKSDTKVKVKSAALLESSERAYVIAAAVANIVRIEIKEEELFIIATAPDVGNIEEVIGAEIKGERKKNVAFNIRLIIDALRVIDSKEVILELSSALSPGLIRPDNSKEYVYIVMPIRTQEAVTA